MHNNCYVYINTLIREVKIKRMAKSGILFIHLMVRKIHIQCRPEYIKKHFGGPKMLYIYI